MIPFQFGHGGINSPEIPPRNIPVASLRTTGLTKSYKFLGTVGILQVVASVGVEVLDPHLQLDESGLQCDGFVS